MAAAGLRRDQVAKCRSTQDDLNIARSIGMQVEAGGSGCVDGDCIHDASLTRTMVCLAFGVVRLS